MNALHISANTQDITTHVTFHTHTPNPLTHARSVKHNLTVSVVGAFTKLQHHDSLTNRIRPNPASMLPTSQFFILGF